MYENNPWFDKALAFMKENDLDAMPVGTHVIDEGNLWVNIVETTLKPKEKALLEAHDCYIDIQVPLSCAESYGIARRADCGMERGAFDVEKDIVFFDDPIDEIVTREPGEYIVFGPETAHAPLIGEGSIKKAIFKVRVSR